MHVGATLDAIKKRGHFKDYKEAQKLYVSQKEAVKQLQAALALLDRVMGKGAEKIQEVFKEGQGSQGYC
jgi:hypothetical protein